jgi:hypothetical protein
MTRATQVTQAVSAMRKSRTAPGPVSEPAAMSFVIFEDNARYQRAARAVHRGASRASFDDRPGDGPAVDLFARRAAAKARDRLDAERWSDEGGAAAARR